jgi:hypothetical protein
MRWICALTIAIAGFSPAMLFADEAEVTVIAILASDRSTKIDKKLESIAAEIRKRDKTLTGFTLDSQTKRTLQFNKKESFPLVDNLNADVTVISTNTEKAETKVIVKGPDSPQVEYTIKGEKYFPIKTDYQRKEEKERLYFAIMVKPLPAKPADKDKEKK